MQNVIDMSKDQMFKLRLDADDRRKLDELSVHFSAPAATVVRMLIKDKHREVLPEPTRFDPFTMVRDEEVLEEYVRVLKEIRANTTPEAGASLSAIEAGLQEWQYPHNARIWKALPRMLNEIVRAGYAKRKERHYHATTKATDYLDG